MIQKGLTMFKPVKVKLVSNNDRENSYAYQRKRMERMNMEQQLELDRTKAIELGEIAQGEKYAKILGNTLKSAIGPVLKEATREKIDSNGVSLFLKLIKDNKVSELGDLVKKSGMVQEDEWKKIKETANENLAKAVENGSNDELKARILSAAFGKNLTNDLSNLVGNKPVSSGNAFLDELKKKLGNKDRGLKSVMGEKSKRDREIMDMGQADKESSLMNAKYSALESKAKAKAKSQEELDLELAKAQEEALERNKEIQTFKNYNTVQYKKSKKKGKK